MSLNLDAILELLKQHVSPAARRVPKGWEIIAREAHRQGVIDGRAIQMESTSQYDAAGASERADADTAGAKRNAGSVADARCDGSGAVPISVDDWKECDICHGSGCSQSNPVWISTHDLENVSKYGAAPVTLYRKQEFGADVCLVAAGASNERADAEKDAARWKWLKMQSTVGEQWGIMKTPWGQWDAYADAAILAAK
jgi:hypothetical protein